jgi:hypothetical protein
MSEAAPAGAPASGSNTGGVAGGGVAPVTPGAAPAAPVTPPATAAPAADWTSGFNDEMKGYIQNKGFKTPADLAESYRNFEKLQGVPQDRLLKLPEKLDSPEARAIWERLGTPKEAKDYQLEVPAQGGDQKMAEWAANEFHKLGVPKPMAEGFVKAFNARAAQADADAKAAAQAASATAEANLKTEWGNAFEQNKARVEQAARVLGIDDKGLLALNRALGPEGAPKLLLKLAAATQEGQFITGQPVPGVLTPEQAQSQITDLRRDSDFVQRLAKGDHEARQKWSNLHQAAFPGSVQL